MQTFTDQQDNIYTVSRLNNEVRFVLEDTFPFVWVEGEISNFAAPGSGHWYFCMKDASAQVNCAMFRTSQRKVRFTPKDGAHVLIKARVSLYESSGRFQLIAEEMEERGEGKLRRAFDALKKKLETEGLFDAQHKKPLPSFPTQVGVITSPTGAAIRDILTVLKRRYPGLPVIIYPTLVQGDAAAPGIVKAIETANRRDECDVLILARGGGSIEDLWPFNEEIVARSIFASRLPIISGVGHEVDFTIADFVADVRAPTPSAAAEIISPDGDALLLMLRRQTQQLVRATQIKLQSLSQQLAWTQKHLQQQHPKRRLTEKMQQLDFQELTLVQLQTRLIQKVLATVKQLEHRLHRKIPLHRIHLIQSQLERMQTQIDHQIAGKMGHYQTQIAQFAAKLDGISPLATLTRGFAIATTESQRIIHEASDVKIGENITLTLQKGVIDCRVENIREA